MKSLIVALSIVLSFAAAAAAPSFIARVSYVNGFGPNICRAQKLLVLGNGQVKALDCEGKARPLATLAPALVQKIVTAAANIAPQELVQAQPEAHGCWDAPSTIYSVVNAKGEIVDVAAQERCLEMVYPNYLREAQSLGHMLEGLSALKSL